MDYIRNIALFLVFIAFAENILAIGQMKKYLRLFCGIIIIFIVLQPVNELLGWDMDISKLLEIDEIEGMAGYGESTLGDIEKQLEGTLSEYGYEVTYLHILPDENSESGIGTVNITVKKQRRDIKIENISLKEANEESEEMLELQEEVAMFFGIDKNIVNIAEE